MAMLNNQRLIIHITILLMVTISISLLITHIPFVYEWRLPFQKNQRLPAARRGGFGSWWTSRQVFCAALGTTRSRWKPLVTTRTEEMKPLENQQTAGKVFEIPRFWLHFETFVCSCSKGSNLAVWEAAPPKDGRLVKAWRSALLADLKMGDLAPKKSISRDLRWLNMIKPSATGISMDFPELNETLEMGLSENAGFRPQLMPRLMGENDAMPMDWGVLYFQTKPHMITY